MDEQRTFQFQIETVHRVGDTHVLMEGRCCADNVYVNDTFTSLYRQAWDKDADGFPHVRLEFETRVTATVAEVRSMHAGLLGTGEAGTIVVETDHPEAIHADGMLEGHA